MGFWRSVNRFFRTWGYRLTGKIDSTTDGLMEDPHVIRATFDDVDIKSKESIQRFIDAVSGLVNAREQNIAKVKDLTTETEKLERMRAGAAAKIKARFEELRAKGVSEEDMRHDEDYLKCRGAYNDFGTTAKEKRDRIAELNDKVREQDVKIKNHKVQLTRMKRKINELQEKKDDLIARVITAKEEKRIADLEAGLSTDTGSEADIAAIEARVRRTEAAAKVTSELAGTDSRLQEAEFEEYARTGLANDEFDALVGLGDSSSSVRETAEPQKAAADLDKELQ